MTIGNLLAGRLQVLGLIITVALATSAHVGTSNASFDGPAGPYGVRVIIRTPGVVPGLAQISIRVTSGENIDQVSVRPLRWDVGLEGAPPPDIAEAVVGDPDLYAAELWLMTSGSYSVQINISGSEGTGTAFVPVMAVAEERLEMHPAMGIGLLGAAVFLFVGAITVFGAAFRESVLEPGELADSKRHRQAHIAMIIGGLVLVVTAWGGWTWWENVDETYMNQIYRPFSTSSTLSITEPNAVLRLTIDDPAWGGRDWSPLMADHGKLMHMFLVKSADSSVFAHLHPTASDSASFEVNIPPLPAGQYRIYGDIVLESGSAQTLVDTVDVPHEVASREPVLSLAPSVEVNGPTTDGSAQNSLQPLSRDPDDSWARLLPFGTSTAGSYQLPSGRMVRWESYGDVAMVDQETTLRFSVSEIDGKPAALETYMGMLSHAAVSRDDGSVFVHLHPSGSINMAAQMRFQHQESTGLSQEMMPLASDRETATPTGRIAFPFVFPTPGPYRIFVQIKVSGEVETAAFDLSVDE